MSQWKNHPGGQVIYTHAGQDATSVFTSFHAGTTWATLEPYCIGECDQTVGVDNAFERDVRALTPEIHKRKLFTAR